MRFYGMTRRSGTVRVRGMAARELSSACAEGALVSDLSLGVWRSQHVARDLCAQLDIREAEARLASEVSMPAESLAAHGRIGSLIDRETRGDGVALAALSLAGAVHAALKQRRPTALCVLLSDRAPNWESGDGPFLAFLSQALRDTPHELRFVACGSTLPDAPPGFEISWSERAARAPCPDATPTNPWALIPGIITPDLLQGHAEPGPELWMLANGCRLVAPELRRPITSCSPDDVDRLARRSSHVPWLTAYAAYHGAPSVRGFAVLWRQALHELESGGYGLALQYLERALELAQTPHERGTCLLLMQSARLKTERFDAAAEQPDPDVAFPEALRAWLWHAKGWALTFRGQPDRADACLQRARDALRADPDREGYLYVTNISALNALRRGDTARAFALENEIRSALEAEDATSNEAVPRQGRWQLRYINHLNLARLFKVRGEFDRSAEHYFAAFATSEGARSDSDLVYLHVNLARLEEARGAVRAAVTEWLRAALVWISSPAPEALATRVMAAVTGDRAALPRHSSCEVLAVRFIDKLLALTRALGTAPPIDAIEGSGEPIAWVRAEQLEPEFFQVHALHLVGAPYAALFAAAGATAPAVSSPALRRLGLLLLWLMDVQLPAGARTLVVHDQHGQDLVQGAPEVVTSCLQLGVQRLVVKGRPESFDAALLGRLDSHLAVLPSPAIDACTPSGRGVVLGFKRYRGPLELQGPLARTMASVLRSKGAQPSDLANDLELDPVQIWPLLRAMARMRLTTWSVNLATSSDVGFVSGLNYHGRLPSGEPR